jgi:nitrite reductase/ring-hydroxylating ferredoxin subunit
VTLIASLRSRMQIFERLRMLVEVAKTTEIAPGGMKFVKAGGMEIVVCNCDGRYFAVDRRCGHMNGPLEMGALDGTILTCPMHHVQFDVVTGEALSRPVPEYIDEPLPGRWAQYMQHFSMLMQHTSVRDIKTFLVKVDGDIIHVEI